MAKQTAKPTGRTAPATRTEVVQMLGMPADLVQDIRDCLRTLPHKEVDQLLKRMGNCQVLDVTVQIPQGPPPAGSNGSG